MKSATSFWDASALVPLCVHEVSSRHAQALLRKSAPVVWWGSLVEVQSAICRLQREEAITALEKKGALSRLRLLSRGWREVLPDDPLRSLALELMEKYSLRAADSLQLAASLVWCQQKPLHRGFVCADRRLAEAGRAAGFSVSLLSK